MPRTEGRVKLRHIFRNANFVKFWVGQIVSYLGDRIDQVAMIAVVSAGATASVGADHANMITFWATLPYVLLSPFAGALIDRFNRRKLMIWMDIFRASVVLVVPFVISPQTNPSAVYVVVALIGAATCVFAPAKSAFVPEILPPEQLLRANSVTSTMSTLTVLAGTVIGGKLISYLQTPGNPVVESVKGFYSFAKLPPGLAVTLTIDSMSYLFSALMLVWIRIPRVEKVLLQARQRELERGGGFFANMRDGFRFLVGQRIPAMCVILDSWFFLVGGILFTLMTKIIFLRAEGVLGENDPRITEYWAYGCASLGLGLAAGGLLTGRFGSRIPLHGLLALCYASAGGFILGLILPLSLKATYINLACIGFSAGAVVVVIETALQKGTPDQMRGRIFSLNNFLLNATLLVSILAGTLLLKYEIPTRELLFATAMFTFAGSFFAFVGLPMRTSISNMKPASVAKPAADG